MAITREQAIAYIRAREPHTIHKTLGIQVEGLEEGQIRVVTEVGEHLFQPTGIVHGGVYVLLAESAASVAAAFEVDLEKYTVAGMEINANHLRPVTEGTLIATPSLLHRGKSSLVYGIEVRDGQGRLVCISRCTMAVKPWGKHTVGITPD